MNMNIDSTDIYTLMEAIRRKESKDILMRNQKNIYNRVYDAYISEILIEKGFDLNVDSIEMLLQREEFSELNRMYVERTLQDDAIIFEECISKVKNLSNKEKEEINLFKTLLKYKNKTVLLSTLYEETFKGILTKEEIENNKNNPEILKEFIKKLNGTILEETVGNVDISNLNPNDFSTIKVEMGTNTDPLLMIKSLTPAPLLSLTNKEEDNVTFLNIADLHLDRDCFDEQGQLDVEKLEENLTSFIAFKDGLIKKLSSEGIKIAGVVYTGDVFDAFTAVNAKWEVKRKDINKFVGAVLNFERRARSGEIISGKPISLGIDSSQAGFVAYLTGNHDMTIGRVKFTKLMRLFGSSIVNPDIVSLSNGGARISVGEDLISVMHHAALDWGFGDNLEFETRNKRDEATFRFDEYLQICQKYYDNLPSDDPVKVQQNNNIAVYDLLVRVNQKIKKENPKLYNFYLPYIINNSDSPTTIYEINHHAKTNIRSTTTFFRNFIVLNNGKLETLVDDRGKTVKPNIMAFKNFINNDGYFKRLEDAYASIREEIPEDKRRKVVIPQFARGDAYQPVITMLSHFHTNLRGSPNRRERKSYGSSKGKGKARNRLINVAIEEGGTKANVGEYSATQYRFDVKQSRVKKIYVKGLEANAKLIKAGPKSTLYAVFTESYETQYNAPKELKTK